MVKRHPRTVVGNSRPADEKVPFYGMALDHMGLNPGDQGAQALWHGRVPGSGFGNRFETCSLSPGGAGEEVVGFPANERGHGGLDPCGGAAAGEFEEIPGRSRDGGGFDEGQQAEGLHGWSQAWQAPARPAPIRSQSYRDSTRSLPRRAISWRRA